MPSWKSPLEGYENAEPLPTGFGSDGRSLVNVPGPRSSTYDSFPPPFLPNKNGFDFHIYYMSSDEEQVQYARELHERIRREFPELKAYRFWDKPVGPHPTPQFEINTFNPHQTGALFTFLVVNRGPCSVFIHPNTGNELEDHRDLATWIGPRWPLKLKIFEKRD